MEQVTRSLVAPGDEIWPEGKETAGRAARGQLEGLSPVSVARLLEAERKTCTLLVQVPGDTGLLFFVDGELVDASLGQLQGLHAAYRALVSANGAVQLAPGEAARRRTIYEPLETILNMVRARRPADWAQDGPAPAARPPQPEDRREVVLRRPELPGTDDGEGAVITLEEGLRRLLALPAEGAAVVDVESGMCLRAGGDLPFFEIVAAMSTEILAVEDAVVHRMAARDPVEDVLITLGGQYHVLRPLRGRPGLCLFVVLDRRKVKLAWARYRIAEVERQLRV